MKAIRWNGNDREYATDGSNVLFSDPKMFTNKPEAAIATLILEPASY